MCDRSFVSASLPRSRETTVIVQRIEDRSSRGVGRLRHDVTMKGIFAFALLLSGCTVSDEEEAGLDSRCTAPCEARMAKGCAGDLYACKLGCTGAYAAADAEGSCKPQADARQDCLHSDAVLELGCRASYDEMIAVCQAEADALATCREARDG
jgi:hypothetical protein